MDNTRAIELMKIERECVIRNIKQQCNRDCANCDLVQKDSDVLGAFDAAIASLEISKRKEAQRNA